jgi:alpha-D-ribose 1-methylphosphonate 5-triphosphate synthase subunit PhnL
MSGRLTLVGRPECGLCEEMLADLRLLARSRELPPVTVIDVDQDAALARRFLLEIPVLLLDGEVVCMHRFDAGSLLARLTPS